MVTPTKHPGNGSALPSESPVSSPGCPIDGLIPAEVHQYIHGLEKRILDAESRLARFESAMMGAAKMVVENPMMSAMLPKDIKTAIRQAVEEDEKKKAAVK